MEIWRYEGHIFCGERNLHVYEKLVNNRARDWLTYGLTIVGYIVAKVNMAGE